MLYIVRFKNGAGEEKTDMVEANSITEATTKAKDFFIGCQIREVTLIPQNKDNVVLYFEGEQFEVDPKTIFQH